MMMRSGAFPLDTGGSTQTLRPGATVTWRFFIGATALTLGGLVLSCMPAKAQDARCIVMLKKEERLIHRIGQRRHEPRLPPSAPGYPGLAVRFDPLPGLGIMQGALWTPEGGVESDDEVKETLDVLEKQRSSLHDAETSAHCAPAH
ncbi:hypothetical protein [Asaia sp. HN010]|uniref:hypothetical protein n=1 Tax=Asaia sp. HN010 TaxID=3081233 RepID=UPI00301A61FD